ARASNVRRAAEEARILQPVFARPLARNRPVTITSSASPRGLSTDSAATPSVTDEAAAAELTLRVADQLLADRAIVDADGRGPAEQRLLVETAALARIE